MAAYAQRMGRNRQPAHRGAEVLRWNGSPLIEYCSFGKADYDFWLSHCSSNPKENASWVYGDFGRLLLRCVDGKYPQGLFAYCAVKASLLAEGTVCVELECDAKLCGQLGAPRQIQAIYTLQVYWYGKDANRCICFPQAAILRFPSWAKAACG